MGKPVRVLNKDFLPPVLKKEILPDEEEGEFQKLQFIPFEDISSASDVPRDYVNVKDLVSNVKDLASSGKPNEPQDSVEAAKSLRLPPELEREIRPSSKAGEALPYVHQTVHIPFDEIKPSYWVEQPDSFMSRPLLSLAEMLPDPSSVRSPTGQIALAAAQGVASGLSELTSPINIAIGIGTAGLGIGARLLTRTPRMLAVGTQAALSGYFATSMGLHLLETVPNLKQAWEKEDWLKTAELLGYDSILALMSGIAGKHAIKKFGDIYSAGQPTISPQRKGSKRRPAGTTRVKKGRQRSFNPDVVGEDLVKAGILNPQIESALTATREPALLNTVKDWLGDRLIYEWKIRHYPALTNAVRLAKDNATEASHHAVGEIVRVLEPLTNSKEYEIFRRLVVLEDFEATGGRGLRLPRNIEAKDIRPEIDRLENLATPAVTEALIRHRELTTKYGKELAKRGLIDPATVDRPYFTHEVLDYFERLDSTMPNLPSQLRTPSRMYTWKRIGSARDIDTNYIDVMFRHTAKLKLDNLMEDFVVKTAERFDHMAGIKKGLSPSQLNEIWGPRGPVPGSIYRLPNGRVVKAWQLEPGRSFYPARTVNEAQLQNAIADSLTTKEFTQLRGPKGGPALKESLVVGRQRRTYLLEEPIADRLSEYHTPEQQGLVFETLRPAIRFWKRLTLDFAGLPFQMNNFVGDIVNLFREDPAALLRIPQAIKALKENAPDTLAAIRELAYEHRVISTSGLFGGEVMGQTPHPKFSKSLRQIQGVRGQVNRFNPMVFIETISTWRENVPRLAKFLTDVERIQKGGEVRTISDVSGLTPIAAAGKAAREFTVDYGAVSPTFAREIRGVLFPFATFYVKNFSRWARHAYQRPGDLALKVGMPFGALHVWNNTGERREIESKLAVWRRAIPHLVTGWKTPEGKAIIISFQTPFDLAARMGGIDKVPVYAADIRNGTMTVDEAVWQTVKDIGLVLPHEAVNLSFPLFRAYHDIRGNKDSFSNRTIVPRRLEGTPAEWQLYTEHLLGQIFTPYAAYLRAGKIPESGFQFYKALVKGPFDVPRALGIHTVDHDIEARSRRRRALKAAENDLKSKKARAEQAFLSHNKDDFKAIIKTINNEPGVKLNLDGLMRQFDSPRVQRDLAKAKLSQTSDPKEQEKIRKRIKALLWKQMELLDKSKGPPIQREADRILKKTTYTPAK
tara:strand:- start:902 stop:4480 length:3579 start_codon:yes stop_codon:yes gene_type:complete